MSIMNKLILVTEQGIVTCEPEGNSNCSSCRPQRRLLDNISAGDGAVRRTLEVSTYE
jgi:hypothetical protein